MDIKILYTPQKLVREIINDHRSKWYANFFHERTSAVYTFAENSYGRNVTIEVSEVTMGLDRSGWFYMVCVTDGIDGLKNSQCYMIDFDRDALTEFVEDLLDRYSPAETCAAYALAYA